MVVDRLDTAREAGASFADKVRGRELQVRRSFVRCRDNKEGPPPLAMLMRGGRGGEVRVKLLLSLLWIGAKPPHDATFPARAWGELLGLGDPAGNGARRIRDAMEWLAVHSFVSLTERPGLPTVMMLRREDASGTPYSVPGAAAVRAKERGRGLEAHRYIRLPSSFWANGWMAAMSTPAIAALLILLAEQSGPTATATWLSPGAARERYALSDQTRYKGLAELEALDLVSKEQRVLSRSNYDQQRTRNTYTLQLSRLEDPAVEARLHDGARKSSSISLRNLDDPLPRQESRTGYGT
jgi:hypothetical protein